MNRLKDAPMDYEFTSRSSSSIRELEADPPKSIPVSELASTNFVHPAPLRNPFFGTSTLSDSPFSFQPPQSPSQWAPPPDFSPTKIKFQPEELKDIDMADASAASPSPPKSRKRQYKSRHKLNPSSLSVVLRSSSLSDDEDDEDTQRTPRRRQRRRGNDGAAVPQTMSHHYTLNMNQGPASDGRADMPYILLGYTQVAFNVTLLLVFLYLLIQFIISLQRDVEVRIAELSADILQEISVCTHQYNANHCDNPIPAMITQCTVWSTCMLRDPTKIGRSRAAVSAEMLAEVVDGFLDGISWRSLIFTLTSLSFFTVFINAVLYLYRARLEPRGVAQPFPQHQPPPFPSQHFGGYLSPAPTPSWGKAWQVDNGLDEKKIEGSINAEEEETPTKNRLRKRLL